MGSVLPATKNRKPSRPFDTRLLAAGGSTGLVLGIIHVIVPLSFAALIFSGRISGHVSQGIGLVLLGGIGAQVIYLLFGAYSGALLIGQDAPSTVMAMIAAAQINSLPPATSEEEVFLTVAVTMAVSALLTGLVYLFLGQFRLGALIRFLPYPVIGGFLAGTGWLLMVGGIGMMAGQEVSLAGLPQLFTPAVLPRWLPGLLVGVAMLAALNRFQHVWVLPGMILGSTALFFGAASVFGAPVDQLLAQGWLLGPLPEGSVWQPIPLDELARVDWANLLAQGGSLFSIVLVSVVSLILNVSAIELAVDRDLDLNRELRKAGLANLVSGFLGGLVNYHAVSTTVLNHRMGRDSRLTGWVIVFVCALVLFSGDWLLNDIPKMILGSLLVMFGVSFLNDWVLRTWSRFPRIEYLIILFILGIIAVYGYLPGVGTGLLLAIILFVVSYSRVNVIRHSLTGSEYHSRMDRQMDEQRWIREQGRRIYILELQGFIFFGTAHQLYERILSNLAPAKGGALAAIEFVILDFRQVSGLDSTATLSFQKMRQLAFERSLKLILSNLSPQLRILFEKAGFLQAPGEEKVPGEGVLAFQDLDHAVEWCENRILSAVRVETAAESPLLSTELQRIIPDAGQVQRLVRYFERQELPAGAYLIHQGDEPDELYFIESGQVTARLESPGEDPVRLETMRGGRVVGELGFYLGIPRTAAVIADEPSVIYRLSRQGLKQIEAEDMAASSIFHQILANLLAERTAHLVDSVNALQRT